MCVDAPNGFVSIGIPESCCTPEICQSLPWRLNCGSCKQRLTDCADVPYELTPDFLEELFTKHRIDYVVHGDDPCLLPDGTDAYAHAKEMGRFKMVSACTFLGSC